MKKVHKSTSSDEVMMKGTDEKRIEPPSIDDLSEPVSGCTQSRGFVCLLVSI